MKYVLIILVLLAAAGGAFYFLKASNADKKTTQFINDSVVAISEGWDVNELKSRADPGLIKAMSSQGQSVDDLFVVYRTLGHPVKEAECTLKNSATVVVTGINYITDSYTCEGEYDNGPASWSIILRKRPDDTSWQIYYMNIESPHFAKPEHF